MAFDFSKLRSLTPEERREDEIRRDHQAIVAEKEERRKRAKETLTGRLVSEPESRFLMNGEREMILRIESGKRTTSVSIVTSGDDAAAARIRNLVSTGAAISAEGYWRPWFKDRSREGKPAGFAFVATFAKANGVDLVPREAPDFEAYRAARLSTKEAAVDRASGMER